MFSKVRVKLGALNHFRKLARDAAPNEIQAYLIGKIVSIDTIEITKFCYTKSYAIQSPIAVQWSQEDYTKLQQYVYENGLLIVGDFHTHPNWDSVMSGTDYRHSILEQQVICGICSVDTATRKTRVRFWTPNSALPCQIIYT